MTDLNRVYCKIRLYDNIFVFFREQQLPLELEKIRNVILNHSSSASLAILQTSLSKAALKERQSNEIAVAEENKSLKDKKANRQKERKTKHRQTDKYKERQKDIKTEGQKNRKMERQKD